MAKVWYATVGLGEEVYTSKDVSYLLSLGELGEMVWGVSFCFLAASSWAV